MPSSIVHAFIPATCVLTSKSLFPKLSKKQSLKLFILSAFLGNFPDWDAIPAALSGDQWSQIHRNWGHNIFSIVMGICLGSYLLRRFVSHNFSKRGAFCLSLCLVLSHVLFDSIQGLNELGQKIGVPLFFPFSYWEFSLPFKVFKPVTISHQTNFLSGYLTSMTFWKEIIYWEFLYIACFWLSWNIFFTAGSYVFKQHKRKKQIEEKLLAFQHERNNEKRIA